MIPSEQAERKRFELWYNNHYDMELITGPDDVEAAWEIWKAAMEDTPVNPVGYVGLTSEGEPKKFRTGNFGSGHPVYLSPVAATPQPEGDGWIRCNERFPTQADGDERCSLWVSGLYENTGNRFVMMAFVGEAIDLAKSGGIDYFMPTGLKRPTPPTAQEGE